MKYHHYIQTIDDSDSVVYTVTTNVLPINNNCIKLTEKELDDYNLYIKYIDCCYLDSKGTFCYDPIKILSNKLRKIEFDIVDIIITLRELLIEAGVLGKTDIVEEISNIINTLNEFKNTDFSKITDITKIDNITCPELHFN